MKKTPANPIHKQKNVVPGKTTARVPAQDIIPSILVAAYIAVDFIPGSKTADVMGNQWLYLSCINLASILFITFSKGPAIQQATREITRSTLSLLYTVLFVLAGLSIAFAINPTESLVCYARLTNTFIMFLSLAVLFYGRMHLFNLLAQVLSVILLVQSLTTLFAFFKGLGETDISTLIYSLKGNAANKNILAAGLVLKIPFTLYCIAHSRVAGKLIHILILTSATLAVFILNARAAYLGIIVELLIFLVLFILVNRKKHTVRQTVLQLSATVLPVIISFVLSLVIMNKAVNLQDEKTPYGTVVQRLGSISLTAEGSNARLALWTNALNYIKNHPVKGAGYGNWKLASIPYEKTFVDDLLVSYHVHNDFLEITAETGLAGGFLYIALFICLSVYALKTIFSRAKEQTRFISLFCLMGIGAYFTDAFFNFPLERPVMQFFFALLMALLLNDFLSTRKQPSAHSPAFKNIFSFVSLLLLLPAVYISYLTYRSLIVQTKVNRDMMTEQPQTQWPEIINAFPPIPDMNMYTFPIGHIKAFYLMKDKRYDEALSQVNKTAGVNPYLTLTEYLKARIFFETNKLDSSFIYAHKAFFTKPRARSNYEMLNDVSIKLNDTSTLTAAFREYTRYRNEAWAWNRYLGIMMTIQGNRPSLQAMVDSALQLFPADTELQQKKNVLVAPAPLIPKEQEDAYRKYFAIGLEAFNNKNYTVAIGHFEKAAAANPHDYVVVENIGVCYYSMKEYARAIGYFDKVLQRKVSTDGKSEFLKGVSLLNLSRKEEGCYYLTLAHNKNYPEAVAVMATYCK